MYLSTKVKNVILTLPDVILVPYQSYHVKKYSEWMKDAELRELTASDALSFECEVEMQKSWANDANKCCFIVCDRSVYETQLESGADAKDAQIEAMVGDVNLFEHYIHEEEYKVPTPEMFEFEVSLMIAEPSARRKGFAVQAALATMLHAFKCTKVPSFYAQISTKNAPSVGLFEKKLQFDKKTHIPAFDEYKFKTSSLQIQALSHALFPGGLIKSSTPTSVL